MSTNSLQAIPSNPNPQGPDIITVTRFDDVSDPNDGKVTLREAVEITASSAFPGPDFIELVNTVTLNRPITIETGNSLFFRPFSTENQNNPLPSNINVNSGPRRIDGQGQTSLFIIESQGEDQNVVFENLILQNGAVTGVGGALNLLPGAEVRIGEGTAFLNNVARASNNFGGLGGAIFVSDGADLTLNGTAIRFQNNQAIGNPFIPSQGLGGALFVAPGGNVIGNNSNITGTGLGINLANTATNGDPFSSLNGTVNSTISEGNHPLSPSLLQGSFDVGSFSDFSFVDENNDGDFDLFLGASDGTIAISRNEGTATNPIFSAPITIRDVGNNSTPTFADIDGDGDQDLFVGDTFGRIHYYRNRGSANGASFAPPIVNPFGFSRHGGLANPDFVDIDGDSDQDLFVGTATGTTLFYRNTGTSTSPNFVRGDNNPFGLQAVSGAAAPNFVDVNSDSDFDVFIGTSDGTTRYFENRGTMTNPNFRELPLSVLDNALPDIGMNATPVLTDINGDGFLDAFIGEQNGTINFVDAVVEGNY